MITVLMNDKVVRMSDVEAARYRRFLARTEGLDDRREPRHPNRQSNSRRAMKNLVRWRNKKATGRYGG